MNSTSLLWLLAKIIIGILLFAGFLGLIALWFQRRSPKYKTVKKTRPPAVTPPATTTSVTGTPAPVPVPATSAEEKARSQIFARWVFRIGVIWTFVIASVVLWYYPWQWKWVLLVVGILLSVLMIFVNPHLPSSSEEKKKDNKGGYTFGKFAGHLMAFLIIVPIALLLLGIFYRWIWLPSYRSTYGIDEPRGQGVSKAFPYKVLIPFSPDPNGAYSAVLQIPDGGRIQFDWNNFPKNVWLDICWNGKEVTRMHPVNHPQWKQPSGSNIRTMEFKAVLVPAGTTSVELGYNLK